MQEKIAYYVVQLVYKDGQDLKVDKILPDQLAELFEKLTSQGLFWYKNKEGKAQKGFWTNLQDVRYLTVEEVRGASLEEKNPTLMNVDADIVGADEPEETDD